MVCGTWGSQRGGGGRGVWWVAWPYCPPCQGCPATKSLPSCSLIPVPGWGQPQPWPVRPGPTDDSHPPWGTERCPVLGEPCPPCPLCCQVCAGRVCPLLLLFWGSPPGTAAAPHPGVPPCPPQSTELGQSPAPRARSQLEPCHGSQTCCDKDGAVSPGDGTWLRGWWWRRGQGQRLPLHPNLWGITALAPYVALPA